MNTSCSWCLQEYESNKYKCPKCGFLSATAFKNAPAKHVNNVEEFLIAVPAAITPVLSATKKNFIYNVLTIFILILMSEVSEGVSGASFIAMFLMFSVLFLRGASDEKNDLFFIRGVGGIKIATVFQYLCMATGTISLFAKNFKEPALFGAHREAVHYTSLGLTMLFAVVTYIAIYLIELGIVTKALNERDKG